jgi:hypothetical protein
MCALVGDAPEKTGDWHQASPGASKSTTSGVDRAIAMVCRRQRQLITVDQLGECGLSRSGMRSRVTAGRLHRVHRKVFCLHPPPLSRRQLFLAAVIACGPGTCLSDLSAAFHLSIAKFAPEVVHVCNQSHTGRSLSGIVVHRRTVLRRDVLKLDGIWCTSPARTIVDCAASLSEELLEDLLMAADAKRSLDRARLEELELIVEADSWRWHGGRLAGESDADRDQLLSMAGWQVVHFTRDQIKHEGDRTGRRLQVLTSGRRLASGDAILSRY